MLKVLYYLAATILYLGIMAWDIWTAFDCRIPRCDVLHGGLAFMMALPPFWLSYFYAAWKIQDELRTC